MNRADFLHLLRAAKQISDDQGRIVQGFLIGSQAIHAHLSSEHFPEEMFISTEVDLGLIGDEDGEETRRLFLALEDFSRFHRTYGIYLDPVGERTATLPPGWRERLVPIEGADPCWRALALVDIAYSKLAAGRDKDMVFLAALSSTQHPDLCLLPELIENTPDTSLRESMQSRWHSLVAPAVNKRPSP